MIQRPVEVELEQYRQDALFQTTMQRVAKDAGKLGLSVGDTLHFSSSDAPESFRPHGDEIDPMFVATGVTDSKDPALGTLVQVDYVGERDSEPKTIMRIVPKRTRKQPRTILLPSRDGETFEEASNIEQILDFPFIINGLRQARKDQRRR